MLKTGTTAPEFALPDQNGQIRTSGEFAGRTVVLYFYSKDMTSGCTNEAVAFAELFPRFEEAGAVIIGVSKDSVASHRKFADKYGLPFILLSDTGKEVSGRYDVVKEKTMYGKTTVGVVRTTYVIGPDGTIVFAADGIKAADIPAAVLKTL